jgi:phytoene synthase
MTPAQAFTICESTVRRVDPDRYFSTLFAPADKRPLLYALYAFNHEIARANEPGPESPIGEIRLQWWREAVGDARAHRPRSQPAAVALSEVLSCSCLEPTAFEALIETREKELSTVPFATLASMEAHAEATSSALMHMAAELLDIAGGPVELTREAGIAYGLTGILRSLQFHAARGKVFLPENLIAAESVTCADVLAGKCRAALTRVVNKVAACSVRHFNSARTMEARPTIFPAILPAALVPAYQRRLEKFDPLHIPSDISQVRRQFILLRAALRTRL